MRVVFEAKPIHGTLGFGYLLQNHRRIPFEGNNGYMPYHSMGLVYMPDYPLNKPVL